MSERKSTMWCIIRTARILELHLWACIILSQRSDFGPISSEVCCLVVTEVSREARGEDTFQVIYTTYIKSRASVRQSHSPGRCPFQDKTSWYVGCGRKWHVQNRRTRIINIAFVLPKQSVVSMRTGDLASYPGLSQLHDEQRERALYS